MDSFKQIIVTGNTHGNTWKKKPKKNEQQEINNPKTQSQGDGERASDCFSAYDITISTPLS